MSIFKPELISTCRGPRRKLVCFGTAVPQLYAKTCCCSFPAMCSVIFPTTDVMSITESPVENSGQEEEPKNRKRKISLSKYVHLYTPF